MKGIKFRVVLDFEEDVFRDILMPEDANFEALHAEILRSFGYPDNQMASFYMSNEQWDKGEEIPLFDMNEEFGPEALPTMKEVLLAQKIEEKGQRLVYVYDFMLMWCFFVEVIGFEETTENLPLVTTIFGSAPDPNSKESDFMFETESSPSSNTNLNGDDEENDEDDDIFSDFEDGFDEDDLR